MLTQFTEAYICGTRGGGGGGGGGGGVNLMHYFKSILYNSFEDQAPIDFIYKWVAVN